MILFDVMGTMSISLQEHNAGIIKIERNGLIPANDSNADLVLKDLFNGDNYLSHNLVIQGEVFCTIATPIFRVNKDTNEFLRSLYRKIINSNPMDVYKLQNLTFPNQPKLPGIIDIVEDHL